MKPIPPKKVPFAPERPVAKKGGMRKAPPPFKKAGKGRKSSPSGGIAGGL